MLSDVSSEDSLVVKPPKSAQTQVKPNPLSEFIRLLLSLLFLRFLTQFSGNKTITAAGEGPNTRPSAN